MLSAITGQSRHEEGPRRQEPAILDCRDRDGSALTHPSGLAMPIFVNIPRKTWPTEGRALRGYWTGPRCCYLSPIEM
jgi:hypothetical protein